MGRALKARSTPGLGSRPDTLMTTPILHADALVAGYDRAVVGPVTLELYPGEILGLWGANGSGKSTLLRALMGGARIYSGRVQRSPRLRLAYQPQRPEPLNELPMTGAEAIRMLGARRCQPPARLSALLHQRIDRLSGGQYQLLAVWLALVGEINPGEESVVLLDEPGNNLDAEALSLLRELLLPIGSDHHPPAIIIVSHDRQFLDAVTNHQIEIRPYGSA